VKPDPEVDRAIERGTRNQDILRLAHNWCAHLTVGPWGGIGLVEQMTGLPIGIKQFRCPYAKAAGFAGADLGVVVLDFYERNCVGCTDRKPVRLPNVLQLVEAHDIEQKRREELARSEAEMDAIRLDARLTRRVALRQPGDAARSGLFDILDRLDRNPNVEDQRILLETCRAVPERFDAGLQTALFELAKAGGHIRTEAALAALASLACDSHVLLEVALSALARREATRTAGDVVAARLDSSQKELLCQALPAIIHLCSPLSGIVGPSLPGDASALIAAYRLFPGEVHAVIRTLLESSDKCTRIAACNGIIGLVHIDATFGVRVCEDLLGALGRTDDYYGPEGSAEGAVVRALAEAMKNRPIEIDRAIQLALAAASDSERGTIFRPYVKILQPEREKQSQSFSEAIELSFRRVVETLTQRPFDKRFEEAAHFLLNHGEDYPLLLDKHAETLLGAGALIAGDLENPYSPLLDPRPTPLKELEEHTRHILLRTALRGIVQSLGQAAARHPHTVGTQVLQMLERLGDSHDRLRAALVESIGLIGRSHDGLSLCLPALYRAMMDSSPRTRAAAATAYAEVAEKAWAELPSLLHESFILLLYDPFVVVHWSAIQALRRVPLTAPYEDRALRAVTLLIRAYAANRSDDSLLAECLERFMELSGCRKELNVQALQFTVRILALMQPQEVGHFVNNHRHRLRRAPGIADLIVKILKEPSTYHWELDDLVEELNFVPPDAVRRLSDPLRSAAAACIGRGVDLNAEFIQILSDAAAWSTAVAVADDAAGRFDDSRWYRSRKLIAQARKVAAELELAVSMSQRAAVMHHVDRWKELDQQIRANDEENRQSRVVPQGLPSPSRSH